MDLTVSAIVVSYNTREMTLQCLAALHADLVSVAAEVWVVDNGSSDGSADAIAEAFPKVKLIREATNVGFGVANNEAIRRSTGRYVLLLNSDAFPYPGSIAALINCLDSRTDVGLVGPRLLNRDGSLQRSCYRFPGPWRAVCENFLLTAAFPNSRSFGDYRAWPHDRPRDVDFVIGACCLARREAIMPTTLFDPDFFFYGEDIDWCYRIRAAGWQVAFTPLAEVVHFGGGSGKEQPDRVFADFHSAVERFYRKHYGRGGLYLFRVTQVVGAGLRIAAFSAARVLRPQNRRDSEALVRKWVRILRWALGIRPVKARAA